MSDSLPKYSYNGYNDDTESAPLITREAEEQQKRSEMGRPTATSVGVATQSSSGPGPRHNVLYVFEPIYPVPGSMEQVVGVLGRDREECISIAQRAFPTLLSYPDERIQFEVASSPAYAHSSIDGTSGHAVGGVNRPSPRVQHGQLPTSYPPSQVVWSRIMDDAWAQFADSPPGRLRVTIKETKAETKLRRRRDCRKVAHMILLAVLLPILTLGLMLGMIAGAGGLDN